MTIIFESPAEADRVRGIVAQANDEEEIRLKWLNARLTMRAGEMRRVVKFE